MVLLWDNTQVEKRNAWTHQAVQGHLSEERTLEQDSRTGLTPPPSLQSEEEKNLPLHYVLIRIHHGHHHGDGHAVF